MTREEKIEQLQSWVLHGHIINLDDLRLEISCAEYAGDDPIDPYEDVLSPINYNSCDRCGDLYLSEEMCWLDCIDWEDGNPTDQAILNGINKEKIDYCAVCYKCLNELKEKGKEK